MNALRITRCGAFLAIVAAILISNSAVTSFAGVTGWSTSNYLKRDAEVYNTRPFFVAVWFNAPAFSATYILFDAAAVGTGQYREIVTSTAPGVRVVEIGNGGSQDLGGSVVTTNTWQLVTAHFVASNARYIEKDAAGKATGTTEVGTVATNTTTRIGASATATSPFNNTGGIAEVSIWGGSMTTAQMESLSDKLFNGGAGGAGGNPLNIDREVGQPWSGALVAYWRLNSHTDLADLSGNGHDMSVVGTLSAFGSHPTIEAEVVCKKMMTLLGVGC